MRSVLVAVAVVGAALHAAVPQPPAEHLQGILDGLARRTQEYYDRFVNIICTETVTQQDLRFNLAPVGRPRVIEYELSVTRDPEGRGEEAFKVGRVVQTVNGRPARKNHTPECADPKTGSPEPLAFLLAANQPNYRFERSSDVRGGPAGAAVLHYVESPPKRVQISWRENCFEATGGGQQGRVWFDPETFDVLQVEVNLPKPIPVPLPSRYWGLQPAVRIERSESTLRFSRVAFENPAEVALLPESIETLTVFRGVLSRRTTQTLTGYRRFLSESRIQ